MRKATTEDPLRVLVIGGGPAGIVTLKTLLHHTSKCFDPLLVEATDEIGGTFLHRRYENGVLVSSKQLTAFSDFRIDAPGTDHVSMSEYCDYLKRYVRRFELDDRVTDERWGDWAHGQSRMRLGVKAVKIEKTASGQHQVTLRNVADGNTATVIADALAICTGLHDNPSVPLIKGIENLRPQSPPVESPLVQSPPPDAFPSPTQLNLARGVRAIHSSQYKKRDEFKDRRVVICGVGETGMDLSYEAVQAGAKEVVLCHRGGFLSFPKVLNDFKVFGMTFDGQLPIDGLITNLFETAYVHPWVAASHLRWFVSDFVIKRVMWFMTGTQAGCSQWVGGLPDERAGRAYVFLNKSSKAMPYINRPYRPKNRWFERVFKTHYIDPPFTTDLSIDLALWPSHVDETGRMHFTPSSTIPQNAGKYRPEEDRMAQREVRPDMVVFATGYKQDWSILSPEYARGPSDPRIDVRGICSRDEPDVGYIGFVRPGVGAIPPQAELASMFWALLLLGQIDAPTDEPHYKLLAKKTARIQYGVDYSSYMSTLARDMGAAPSLMQLLRTYGLKTTFIYCFGAAFTPFYRLTGPYADPAMQQIVETEIWDTIKRRGVIGNLFMGLIPMIFYGLVNLVAYVVEGIWIMSGRPDLSGFVRSSPSKQVENKKVA